jgi:hypothetical protein
MYQQSGLSGNEIGIILSYVIEIAVQKAAAVKSMYIRFLVFFCVNKC